MARQPPWYNSCCLKAPAQVTILIVRLWLDVVQGAPQCDSGSPHTEMSKSVHGQARLSCLEQHRKKALPHRCHVAPWMQGCTFRLRRRKHHTARMSEDMWCAGCQFALTRNLRQSCAAFDATAIARGIDDESRTLLSICKACISTIVRQSVRDDQCIFRAVYVIMSVSILLPVYCPRSCVLSQEVTQSMPCIVVLSESDIDISSC